jgi:2-polyprenyl-6-methoxyphenol hydroxylase-like FAD-dependent oxidoreductase
MCSGIRDAANLAWKLDLVLAGRGADAVLDTYASERIPQLRQVVDFSIALGKVICVADPEEAHARDTAMVAAARERGLTPIDADAGHRPRSAFSRATRSRDISSFKEKCKTARKRAASTMSSDAASAS